VSGSETPRIHNLQDVDEWSFSRFGRFIPGEELSVPINRRCSGRGDEKNP
jgi:hypothetical protein